MLEFLTGEKRYVASCCYTPEEYAEVIEAVASGQCLERLTDIRKNKAAQYDYGTHSSCACA